LTLDHSDVGHRFDQHSLSLLGVRYIIADRGLPAAIARLEGLGYAKVQEDPVRYIFENREPLPRAFAVPLLLNSDRLPNEHPLSALVAATTVDRRLLPQAQRLGIEQTAIPMKQAGSVSLVSYHHDEVRMHASLKAPGVVVLMDSWHPNWRATVDQEESYVGCVNLAFRGIALPAGEHEIRFFYRPRTLRAGQAISALTLAALLALIIARRIGALARAPTGW